MSCELATELVREAAEREAVEDFLLRISAALNGSSFDFLGELLDAVDELDDALAFAACQFHARLALCALLGHGPYDPELEPDEFSTEITNTFFPQMPGRTLVYEMKTADGLERVEVTALAQTVEIGEFECRVVRDRVFLDGELVEDTDDFYAQRESGDVWYFGEVAQNFEDGFLEDLDGSFRAGVENAKPGILMLAAPTPGDIYRQEFLLDEAEDVARVVSLGETVQVPFGSFAGCLQTEDYSPLDPLALERKFYAPGIGIVLEVDLDTGERLELVDILEPDGD